MPEPFKTMHQGHVAYGGATHPYERLQDGISDSGSEEQALKTNLHRIHAEVPTRPIGQGGLTTQ